MSTPARFDRERELGAEARARELVREVAGEEVLELYDAFGFIWFRPRGREYAYLLYPHRPIIVFDLAGNEPLGEWCVRFRDAGEPLPPADDVLAKWLSLSANERGLAERANVDPLGTQTDPQHVRRDLARLHAWRLSRGPLPAGRSPGSDRASSPAI